MEAKEEAKRGGNAKDYEDQKHVNGPCPKKVGSSSSLTNESSIDAEEKMYKTAVYHQSKSSSDSSISDDEFFVTSLQARDKDDQDDNNHSSNINLVQKVAQYFFEDETFANFFEGWVVEKSAFIDLSTTECRFSYTQLHNEFKQLFEDKITGKQVALSYT